jgi:hypothetical protein
LMLGMEAQSPRPSLRQRADQRLWIMPFKSGRKAAVQNEGSSGLGASAILANCHAISRCLSLSPSCHQAASSVSSRPMPVARTTSARATSRAAVSAALFREARRRTSAIESIEAVLYPEKMTGRVGFEIGHLGDAKGRQTCRMSLSWRNEMYHAIRTSYNCHQQRDMTDRQGWAMTRLGRKRTGSFEARIFTGGPSGRHRQRRDLTRPPEPRISSLKRTAGPWGTELFNATGTVGCSVRRPKVWVCRSDRMIQQNFR